jgi:hypothetical protein
MQLSRNQKREDGLFNALRQSFLKKDQERISGIKLSDLLSPRQAYYQKKHPRPPTDLEINYWIIGRGHEDIMHRETGLYKPESKQWEGIFYGIDFMIDEVPIEMKTRRGYLAKEGEEINKYESYLNQLLGYCACENMLKGELWIWSLLEKTDTFRSAPKLVCYDIDFIEEELNTERARLLEVKDLLTRALDGDKEALDAMPKCPDWKCFRKETNMITQPRCITCDKDFKTEFGIESHLNAKTGKGHTVKHATYDIKILPACKHYDICKGTV